MKMGKKGPRTLKDREVYLAPNQAYPPEPVVQSLLPLIIDNGGLEMAAFHRGVPRSGNRFPTNFDHSLFVIFHWPIGAFLIHRLGLCVVMD
jgi:hypothetical protein